jgi:aldehyde:ferredoxin oxidoreductase
VTGQGLPKYGTQVLMNVINEMGALPTRNHRDVQFEDAGKISAEAMHEKRPTDGKAHLVTNAACFGCTIACGRISKIDETHFSVKNSPNTGAHPAVSSTKRPGRSAPPTASVIWKRCSTPICCATKHGMDPISFGATVGAAVMELYDLGILSKEQIGVDARFGSAEALCKLVEMTARAKASARSLAWAAPACAPSTAARICR